MKHVFNRTSQATQTVARDAHDPETIYVHTETHDKPGLEAAKRIRDNELLKRDARSPLYDGDVIAFSFSFPTVMDWSLARKKEPDLFHQVQYGTDSERFAAAQRLEILYPQYVTTVRRGDARRQGRNVYGDISNAGKKL